MTKRSIEIETAVLSAVELADELTRINLRCAWAGCTARTPLLNTLPPGWRWLLAWQGEAGLDLRNQKFDRDGVLCPQHFSMLHNELLEDIGQRLDQPEGTA